jgi:hypothetical protein
MTPTTASTTSDDTPTGGRTGGPEDIEAPRRRGISRRRGEDSIRRIGAGPGPERAMSLAVAARDYVWLYDFRHGVGIREIAAREGLGVRSVQQGINRARALDAKFTKDDLVEDLKPAHLGALNFRLTPLFPIVPFTPESTCPHRDPIKRGSSFCCMVCHASGMDDHPGLRPDPQTDPAPDPEPASGAGADEFKTSGGPQESRKQRRRRQLAEAAAVA